jgi:hypothetical protein
LACWYRGLYLNGEDLKYILKVWNSLDLSKPNAVVLGMDTLLRHNGYYHLAKLLREEQKWEEA